jgi:hypothetical protein
MPTRLLHVGDTRIRAAHERDADDDPTGGLTTIRERAESLDADVLFTGNLFSVTEPAAETVQPVRDCLDTFADAEITLYYIVGARDSAGDWNPWDDDALGTHPAAEHLDTNPTDVGPETAVFGIDDLAPSAFQSFLHDREEQFVRAAGVSQQLLVVSQEIAPPAKRGSADARAFEVATNVNLHLDVIAAGGTPHPAEWEHDDTGLGVYYPGSANPYWAEEAPKGVVYETNEDGELRRGTVTLDSDEAPFPGTAGEASSPETTREASSPATAREASSPETTSDDTETEAAARSDESGSGASETTVQLSDPREHPEVTRLVDFFRAYEEYDLEGADTETLIDLYALCSRGKSFLESRRRDVRDALEERTERGQTLDGRYSTVEHREYTTQSLRDDDTVHSALSRAGVDADRVVERVERIDEDALEEVIEESERLTAEDVYEESTRQQIRRKDLDVERVDESE